MQMQGILLEGYFKNSLYFSPFIHPSQYVWHKYCLCHYRWHYFPSHLIIICPPVYCKTAQPGQIYPIHCKKRLNMCCFKVPISTDQLLLFVEGPISFHFIDILWSVFALFLPVFVSIWMSHSHIAQYYLLPWIILMKSPGLSVWENIKTLQYRISRWKEQPD